MGYFPVRYDSRVVNYDRRGFILLATRWTFQKNSLFPAQKIILPILSSKPASVPIYKVYPQHLHAVISLFFVIFYLKLIKIFWLNCQYLNYLYLVFENDCFTHCVTVPLFFHPVIIFTKNESKESSERAVEEWVVFEVDAHVQDCTGCSCHTWKGSEREVWNAQDVSSGQSYKTSTIVIYDSRVVPDWKIPLLRP